MRGRNPAHRSDRECTFLLVRHAETVANVALQLAGWTDADLTPRGERQVEVLAEHFARAHPNVAALYSSTLIRARRTAEAIGALTGFQPVFRDDLREMFFGDLEGITYEVLQDKYADLLAGNEDESVEDFAWPGGESHRGFTDRIVAALDELATAHAGETVGVITHGGAISTFLTVLHGESTALWRRWQVPNASLTEVAWDPVTQKGHLVRHGDASHLAGPEFEEGTLWA